MRKSWRPVEPALKVPDKSGGNDTGDLKNLYKFHLPLSDQDYNPLLDVEISPLPDVLLILGARKDKS